MTRKMIKIKKRIKKIEYVTSKCGEQINECLQEEINNNTYEIGSCVLAIIQECQTEEEYDVANRMLYAICGNYIKDIIKKIEMKDFTGYTWESL